jgi:hypothetical protein
LLMNFELSISINCTQEEVFIFLRDKDQHKQKENSPVLVLERITDPPVTVGTKYREVVQMLPFYISEIFSTITRYEPYEYLEEVFYSKGMKGHLAYQFIGNNSSTKLIQRESIYISFPLNLINPLIKKVLQRKLVGRLIEIKAILEKNK